MSTPEPADQLYHRLLQMHEEAFVAGRFEAGYHILAAALHVAEELESMELLTAVSELAKKRQREMDALQPTHRLSTRSAARRGNTAQYTALAAIATAVKGRISADLALERGHRAMRKGG